LTVTDQSFARRRASAVTIGKRSFQLATAFPKRFANFGNESEFFTKKRDHLIIYQPNLRVINALQGANPD
jgi:hypothetical protein